MLEECEAILVRRSRWSETSLLITWLTDRFGALKTSARGALRPKNPFRTPLDLFLRARIRIRLSSSSDLHTLREVEMIQPFTASSYAALATCSYLAQLSASVAPEMQEAEGIYDLLKKALDYLQHRPPSPALLERFETELARRLGVGDSTAKVPPLEAISGLRGAIPATRQLSLQAMASPPPPSAQ